MSGMGQQADNRQHRPGECNIFLWWENTEEARVFADKSAKNYHASFVENCGFFGEFMILVKN